MDQALMHAGGVIWITGLSGSGKSTLAREVVATFESRGYRLILLDGDSLRAILDADDISTRNHGRDARLSLAFKYAKFCKLLSDQGHIVVIATISLFKEIHEWNRENIANYFEVFLDVKHDELRRRDPKGIYARFDAGTLENVAGLDLPVDEPTEPHLRICQQDGLSPRQVAQSVMAQIEEIGFLTR